MKSHSRFRLRKFRNKTSKAVRSALAAVCFAAGMMGCESAPQSTNTPTNTPTNASTSASEGTSVDDRVATGDRVAAAALNAAERSRLRARARRVEIIRDNYGVPHIKAKTDADAVFGMLYAQAEDDFKRIERNYIWAIGRLAEVQGESALYSDLRARLYMTQEQAVAAYATAPAWLQALCQAWADGLNYYLLQNREQNPDLAPALITRFEPWMTMYFSEGSIGGDIEQIPLAGIKAFYATPGAPHAVAVTQGVAGIRPAAAEPRGSNGFALAPSRTRSGNAMLLINPHTSFYFRGEVHVTSEEGLNAYGAVTWGQFFVYQGFNEHTGWMHTSTQLDFLDEFVEEIVNQDGQLMYRYGDEMRPVVPSEVELRVLNDEGVHDTRRFTVYHTHHGPITHMQDGKWVATKINWDPVNALQQAFLRTKQTDHAGFRRMMGMRTNSSNNTVYADSSGTIAYYHGNFIPRRDPQFDYNQPVDGSNPATDWQGLHTVEESITIVNPANGWLQNCNSTPFTAAGEFSPKPADYPAYMAPDPERFRALHAIELLRDANEVTLDGLIDIAYDPYLPGFAALLPGLVAAFDEQPGLYPELAPAIDRLRQWDYRVRLDSVAMTLAHFYGVRYIEEGGNPQQLTHTKRLIYFGESSPQQERLALFAKTVAALREDFGSWEIPWGEVNRFQRLHGEIAPSFDDKAPSLPVPMASGHWGALASFGAQRYPSTKRLYGNSGNSFVAVVEFGEQVRAKSLLAGGQSGDVNSPHFLDQAAAYVEPAFKPVWFYPSDITRNAERTYHPGQ